MRKPLRIHKTWLIALAITIIALGTLISVLVFATGDSRLTATAYSNLIRFQAEGVATLQVRTFDLSGKEVWNSGIVSGWTVDWERRNDFGEQLAYGAYIYSTQGWNVSGDLIFQKNGKLALMPGDKVQLQAAPAAKSVSIPAAEEKPPYVPMTYDASVFYVSGQLGVGTDTPVSKLSVFGSNANLTIIRNDGSPAAVCIESRRGDSLFAPSKFDFVRTDATGGITPDNVNVGQLRFCGVTTSGGFYIGGSIVTATGANSPTGFPMSYVFRTNPGDGSGEQDRLLLTSTGNVLMANNGGRVGIGTTNPNATLEVHGSATNLLALYDPAVPTSPKFRVTKTGEVRADGGYYSGTGGFHTGSADVAERINTSEWVDAGYVVEIDSEHPGFFRKTFSPYSTKVAGIISTSPGVILGNSFDEVADDWEDNRPVLAIAGRVPLQATTENGPIKIGDLLVSSSSPGVAMKGDPAACVGAVIGKAMEPLEGGEGVIVAQVMLR